MPSSSRNAPKSPWRRLIVKSKSLERMSSSEEIDEKKNASRSPGWGWLRRPPTRFVHNPLQRSSPPKRSGILSGSTSNMSLFLLRLNERMPQYCLLLSDPCLANARAAAEILDASTFSDGTPSSPPSSPNRTFFGNNNNNSSSLVEGEWDTYTSPLLLLTGAEALYGQMQVNDRLKVLYQTIQTELTIVKERLCDPWLAASQQSRFQQAATSLGQVLDGMNSFLKIRCQLVVLEMRLFSEGPSIFQLQTWRELLPASTVDHGSMSHMFTNLMNEVKAWIAVLETASHLEKCRFTETILSARNLKTQLSTSSNTTLQLWFQKVLARFMQIMPMYFDRINAFASPLYGFDTANLWAESRIPETYDLTVLDFLRRHESKDGPSMAVCIVVDAVRTHNLNFGRGFLASHESSAKLTPMEKERRDWHAVYMRTTGHAGPPSSPLSRSPSHGGSSLSTIMRRGRGSFLSSSKRDMTTSEDEFSKSLTNIMRVASHDSTGIRKRANHVNMNVMEYAPETGPSSWPHTEWSSLVELIMDNFAPWSPLQQNGSISIGEAVTYRQPEPKAADKSASLIAHGYDPPLLVPSPPPPPTSTCSFHAVRLSEYLWMVAILKCEEDGKWHLRKARGHNDEEIRAFLNEMSLKLTVTTLFNKATIDSAKKTPRDSQNTLPGKDLVRVWQGWDETDTQGFLRELKRSFQLRPQSPYAESLRRGGTPRLIRKRQQRTVSHSDSAIAFFVGAGLELKQPEARP